MARCTICLSTNHSVEHCPQAMHQFAAIEGQPSGHTHNSQTSLQWLRPQPPRPAPRQRAATVEICMLHNRREGSRCTSAHCWYAHICLYCRGAHSARECTGGYKLGRVPKGTASVQGWKTTVLSKQVYHPIISDTPAGELETARLPETARRAQHERPAVFERIFEQLASLLEKLWTTTAKAGDSTRFSRFFLKRARRTPRRPGLRPRPRTPVISPRFRGRCPFPPSPRDRKSVV